MRSFASVFVLMLCCSCNLEDHKFEGGLIRTTSPLGIVLTNNSNKEIFTFPVGANQAAVINWAPGVSEGDGLAPGKSDLLDTQWMSRQKANDEETVHVYWWYAEWVDGKLRSGPIEALYIDL